MEKPKVTRYVSITRAQFSTLNGDGTEVVRITGPDVGSRAHNGDYLFLKMSDRTNAFIRQESAHPSLIEVLLCETEHFYFHASAGMIPKAIYYDTESVGPNDEKNYLLFREKLEKAGEWKVSREEVSG